MPKLKKLNYKGHKTRWEDCELCELSDQRNRMVFARGRLPAHILFIGEAPGASENALGQPFKGPAGKLFDRLVEPIPQEIRWATTNLVCCFPKEAKKTNNHQPPKAAVLACQPRLLEFYKLAKPQIVFSLGKLAQKWVPKILGQVHPEDGFTIMLHPSAILQMDQAQRPLAIKRCQAAIQDAIAKVGSL